MLVAQGHGADQVRNVGKRKYRKRRRKHRRKRRRKRRKPRKQRKPRKPRKPEPQPDFAYESDDSLPDVVFCSDSESGNETDPEMPPGCDVSDEDSSSDDEDDGGEKFCRDVRDLQRRTNCSDATVIDFIATFGKYLKCSTPEIDFKKFDVKM